MNRPGRLLPPVGQWRWCRQPPAVPSLPPWPIGDGSSVSEAAVATLRCGASARAPPSFPGRLAAAGRPAGVSTTAVPAAVASACPPGGEAAAAPAARGTARAVRDRAVGHRPTRAPCAARLPVRVGRPPGMCRSGPVGGARSRPRVAADPCATARGRPAPPRAAPVPTTSPRARARRAAVRHPAGGQSPRAAVAPWTRETVPVAPRRAVVDRSGGPGTGRAAAATAPTSVWACRWAALVTKQIQEHFTSFHPAMSH